MGNHANAVFSKTTVSWRKLADAAWRPTPEEVQKIVEDLRGASLIAPFRDRSGQPCCSPYHPAGRGSHKVAWTPKGFDWVYRYLITVRVACPFPSVILWRGTSRCGIGFPRNR
jgi:hypothetical protein